MIINRFIEWFLSGIFPFINPHIIRVFDPFLANTYIMCVFQWSVLWIRIPVFIILFRISSNIKSIWFSGSLRRREFLKFGSIKWNNYPGKPLINQLIKLINRWFNLVKGIEVMKMKTSPSAKEWICSILMSLFRLMNVLSIGFHRHIRMDIKMDTKIMATKQLFQRTNTLHIHQN